MFRNISSLKLYSNNKCKKNNHTPIIVLFVKADLSRFRCHYLFRSKNLSLSLIPFSPLISENIQSPCLDVNLCQRQLKDHYLQRLCKIPRFPGDSESCLDMDEIYTNLSIHYEMAKPCAPIKIPLTSHNEIFTRKVNGMLPKRILVLGGGGSGKSTLLAKIAYDWAMKDNESPLKDLPLLFVLNMRYMQYESDLEDAIFHQLLPTDTLITKNCLRNFIEQNPDSVMIFLDSYDEFSRGEVLRSSKLTDRNVVGLLSYNCLTSCRVLVSSRHWRASDFSGLGKIYAKIEIEGFSEINVKGYIMRYFHSVPNVGERLHDSIKNNKLLPIASVPLMTQLFCLYWVETGEKGLPDKISDLYTEVVRILYKHCLAKEKLPLTLLFDDIVLQLGRCACLGLWPPENRLVFLYEEVKNITSIQCIEDGCKTGIISIEKEMPTYKSSTEDEIDAHKDGKSIVFFHKSIQEKCAGEYLSHLASTQPNELMLKLQQLDTVQACLSVQMVLRFACGSSLKAARHILKKLVEIAKLELQNEIRAYYDDTLKDPDICKTVQEFIKVCLLCNYESGSYQFSQLLAILFPSGKIQFLGLSPYLSDAVAHYLHDLSGGKNRNSITKIRIMQIPKLEVIDLVSRTTVVNTLKVSVQDNLNSLSSDEEVRKLFTDYVERHQGMSGIQKFTSKVGSSFSYGLIYIEMWEYFKTWHTANYDINIDRVVDAAKFTSLNELDLSNLILTDAGQRLVDAVEHGHLTSLTHLILPGTGMNVENMNRLVALLPQCTPELQTLDISDNNAADSQVILHMIKSFPKLSSLQVLNISDMYATASDVTTLSQVIPKCCSHLTELRMGSNYMNDETGKTLVTTLPYAQHLQVLRIYVNGMSKKVHGNLVKTMGKLVQLRELRMYHSPFVDDLILYTADVVKSLNLTRLALKASYRDPSVLERLFASLKKTKNTTDENVPVLNRTIFQPFLSSLQHQAARRQWLNLWNVRLHEADLQALLTLCKEHDITLG